MHNKVLSPNFIPAYNLLVILELFRRVSLKPRWMKLFLQLHNMHDIGWY